MTDLKQPILTQFKKVAELVGATWFVFELFCALVKNGVTMRVRWSVDGISGVFVTLSLEGSKEYGLCYLVEFWGGSSADIAKAYSDDLQANLEVTMKYAADIFDRLPLEFSAFEAFTVARIQENLQNLPPIPTLEDNDVVKRAWLKSRPDPFGGPWFWLCSG